MVQRDPVCANRLGSPITSGELRAYKIDGGSWGLNDSRAMVWKPLRVQMIFDVAGEHFDGLVTVEAEKSNGMIDHKLVGVDVLNSTAERVLVVGDEARLKVKDQLRAQVKFKSTTVRGVAPTDDSDLRA